MDTAGGKGEKRGRAERRNRLEQSSVQRKTTNTAQCTCTHAQSQAAQPLPPVQINSAAQNPKSAHTSALSQVCTIGSSRFVLMRGSPNDDGGDDGDEKDDGASSAASATAAPCDSSVCAGALSVGARPHTSRLSRAEAMCSSSVGCWAAVALRSLPLLPLLPLTLWCRVLPPLLLLLPFAAGRSDGARAERSSDVCGYRSRSEAETALRPEADRGCGSRCWLPWAPSWL